MCINCSDKVGWSEETTFRTPPAGGEGNDFHFLAFGDMGKAPLDLSAEHFIQVYINNRYFNFIKINYM